MNDESLSPEDRGPVETSPVPTAPPTAPPTEAVAPVAPPPGGVSGTTVVCVQCAYDLSGAAIGGTCPECGCAVAASLESRIMPGRMNGLAVAAFVLGLMSFVGCLIVGPVAPFFGILAIVFGAIGLKQCNGGSFTPSSRSLAAWGLGLGIVSLVLMGAIVALLMFGAM